MDQTLAQFRRAAERENRGRRRLQRRYSPALQSQAIAYCRQRRQAGDRMHAIAAALGVAEWSLQRWMRGAKGRPQFEAVQVLDPEPARTVPSLALRLTAEGPRVEGLDVETIVQLLERLR